MSLSFPKALTQATARTTNGAESYATSGSACLQLFSLGVSADFHQQVALIKAALEENLNLAVKIIYYLRDCRGGQGHKDIIQVFYEVDPELLIKTLPAIATYGSYKDVCKLLTKNPRAELLKYFASAINRDDALACKWAPRKGHIAKLLANTLNLTSKQYRQLIVTNSKTVEQQMCRNEWPLINYKGVPSRANKVYNKAFLKHDEIRRRKFLTDAIKGKVSLKAGQLYPHEIYKLWTKDRQTADALWQSLPDYMADLPEQVNILPIIDTSSSMHKYAYSGYCCMDIAIGLGLYVATHNKGAYKNVWCNFHETPNFLNLEGNTLTDYMPQLMRAPWGGSTNLQAVFDKILAVAKTYPQDTPKYILLVSDMQFNDCSNRTNLEAIRAKYKEAGIDMPIIIFWRVDVSTDQPTTKNETSTILINGYSPAILKSILTMKEETDPYQTMLETIGTRYDLLDNYL